MGVAAAAIGGGWQVATRMATTANIAPADLALLRYAVPALLLLPVLRRCGLLPAGVPHWRLALMVAGAGLPFGLLAMTGSRLAPASHMGVLMAGASPLIAALLARAVFGERPGRLRGAGLLLMATGVALLGWDTITGFDGGTWQGDALFLLAATLWATFTLSYRGSLLTPWQAAAVVNGWSAIAVVAAVLLRGGSGLAALPASDLLWLLLWQGVLAGVLGLWTYAVAIQALGAARAAAFGALAPVVSALGGLVWLGDAISATGALAIAATAGGVLLASGALQRAPIQAATPAADKA